MIYLPTNKIGFMSSPRSIYQIYMETLDAIKRGINKPNCIRNELRYCSHSMNKVLNSMVREGLVEYEDVALTSDKRRRYRITVKGEEVLNALNYNISLIVALQNS